MDMRIEKDGNEWVAVLPPHPDMPDEELGLPASTREEAEAEGRAYEAIVQSSLYKFDFDDAKGVYVVSIGKEGEKHEAPLLAEAYKQAQEAYSKRIQEPPPPEAAPPAPEPKKMRKPRQQGNGAKQQEPKPEPEVLPPEKQPDWGQPNPNITTGHQLQDAAHRARIDRLEMILVAFARTIIKEIKEGA